MKRLPPDFGFNPEPDTPQRAGFSALIYSPQQGGRSLLGHQLRAIGGEPITQVSRLADAKRSLEFHKFDVVVLDDDDNDSAAAGRTMVEDLRRCGHLDIKTIVILTSSLATYSRVSDAAESGVDSFLLRPFSQNAMQERIETALTRRHALGAIYQCLGVGDWQSALAHCQSRIQKKQSFWLYAARIAGEILLSQGQLEAAHAMYQVVLQANALPWAKLGVGRVLFAQRKHHEAATYLSNLAQSHPEQTDTYDLMAEAHLELGQITEALNIYQVAAKATPGSVSRLQRLGFAAHFCGDSKLAIETLERSIRIGARSKSFDSQSLVFLGHLYTESQRNSDLKDLIKRAHQMLEHAAEPQRLQDHIRVLDAYLCASSGQLQQARSLISPLFDQVNAPATCIDQAFNTSSVLALLAQMGHTHPGDAGLIEYLSLRFSHTKLSALWLARSAKPHAPYADQMNRAYEQSFQMAQTALKPHLTGNTSAAVAELVQLAADTLNIRIIDMASKLVQRHANDLVDACHLQLRIEGIKTAVNLPEKQKNPVSRYLKHPGGLSLTARSTSEAPRLNNESLAFYPPQDLDLTSPNPTL